ncbi:hypothetical protein DSUL_50004 [Desulfovibrionales bacterium]
MKKVVIIISRTGLSIVFLDRELLNANKRYLLIFIAEVHCLRDQTKAEVVKFK